MLWRDKQQPVGSGDFRFETDNALRQLGFEVLAIEGEIIDRDEMEGELPGSKPG